MHYTGVKAILSAGNRMNLYRGCLHGCIYCDSRSKCYHMAHDFEDIEVKENALELLEDALRRKRKRCVIGTGSMSDPYIPIEDELGMTRGALELIEKYGHGVTLSTKSARVMRDIELLERINRRAKCVVQMTLTTCDEALCRAIEPNVSTTRERVAALCALRDAGIPTVVWLCPILPFINDTRENIAGILDYCTLARVRGVINFGMGLTLRDGNREYFYAQLDRLFPGLSAEYRRRYGNAYEAPSPRSEELLKLFHETCQARGLMHDNGEIFEYIKTLETAQTLHQLSFFE